MSTRAVWLKKYILRFIKYNLVGSSVFFLNVGIYYAVYYPLFKESAVWPLSITGALLEFTALTIVNRTKLGNMFDTCKT